MAVYIRGKILADDSLKIPRGLESKVWMNDCYPLPERDATKKSLEFFVFMRPSTLKFLNIFLKYLADFKPGYDFSVDFE